MAVLFALITLAGWAIGDIIIAKTSRKIGSLLTLFWMLVFGTILLLLYIPFTPGLSDWGMFLFATLIGFINISGAYYYFKGFEKGNVSIVGTVANSFSMLTAVASIIIFKERLSSIQLLGIVLVGIGLVVTSFDFQLLKAKKIKALIPEKTIIYALIAMVTWSIYYTFIRIPIGKIGWFWAGFPTYLAFIPLILFKLVNKNVFIIFAKPKLTFSIIIYSILVTVAYFSFNLGLTYGYTSIVAPIAGSVPVLFVLLSRYIFNDPLTPQQRAGIGLSLLGIVLIAFSSV